MAIFSSNGLPFAQQIARLSLYFQRISSTGGFSVPVYLSNTASDLSGYKKLTTSIDVAETEVSITANNGTTLGQAYVAELPIGVSQISAGSWAFDYYRKVSSTALDSFFGIDFFMVNPSTLVETPLFSLESTSIEDLDYTERPVTYSKQLFTVDPTHRLGCRLKFRTTRNVNTTGTYIVGNGRGLWFRTPLTPRHSQLRGLSWLLSGHTGTANKLFGTDENGASKEYALTDFGSKRLVVQNTIGHITILNGIAIKKGTPTKIATCDSSYTYIWQLNADASCERLAKIATANAQLILYVESVNEFHVFGNLSTNLYRIDGTTNALNGTTTINAQTTVNRYGCCQSATYEYYSSDAGTVLNQRNISSGIVATKTVGNQIHSIRCFSQGGVNYVAIQYYRTLDIYNESLTLVSSANIGLQYYFKSMDYRDNKLYVSSCSPTSDNDQYLVVVDTSNINSLTFEKKYFQTGRILKMADYLLTESHANLTYDQNCFLTLRNNDLTAVDTLTLQPNANGWMNWIHDDVNDVIIGLTSYNLLPFMSKIFILKIK